MKAHNLDKAMLALDKRQLDKYQTVRSLTGSFSHKHFAYLGKTSEQPSATGILNRLGRLYVQLDLTTTMSRVDDPMTKPHLYLHRMSAFCPELRGRCDREPPFRGPVSPQAITQAF